jgi:D-alanyl-D-alanine carboxypeptidase/D-alanyl-D-alanine-endopeptidase (penicillin-binding protein 4)
MGSGTIGMNKRTGQRAGVALAVGMGLVLTAAVPADAAPIGASERRMATRLNTRIATTTLGTHTSGIVIKPGSGRVIWSKRSTTGRRPGSVAKLATALTAMDRLGPDFTVTTRITTGASSGEIVFVGAGDEMLTSKDLAGLAARAAWKLSSAGISSVSLKVDDSLFPKPTAATGWKASYYPYDVSPVRALIVDQRAKMDTSLDAGQLLAGNLEADGIDVTSVSRGVKPAEASVLSSHTSPPMKTWLQRMLLVSDADIAEGVSRLVALHEGHTATWTNARAARTAVLKKYKITGSILYDGSGLSRSDRMTAKGIATLLRVLYKHESLRPVISWLPVAGKSGTLKYRFASKPASCAKGRVQAKSGSLGDMIAMAGVAKTSSGALRVFVFMESGKKTGTAVKKAIDGLAATVTGCW